ncbi:RNA pseudouridine synthase 2, chloroplastic [Tanacetum coccineum]
MTEVFVAHPMRYKGYNGFMVLAFDPYRIVEILAGGGCALVEWRLETGRTHQIRAHAKYLGIPLMGDEVYGGSKNMALSRLQLKNPSSLHGRLSQLVGKLDRPCLHALTLGFTHPCTGEKMQFSCLPPVDFAEILTGLRQGVMTKFCSFIWTFGDQHAALDLISCELIAKQAVD